MGGVFHSQRMSAKGCRGLKLVQTKHRGLQQEPTKTSIPCDAVRMRCNAEGLGLYSTRELPPRPILSLTKREFEDTCVASVPPLLAIAHDNVLVDFVNKLLPEDKSAAQTLFVVLCALRGAECFHFPWIRTSFLFYIIIRSLGSIDLEVHMLRGNVPLCCASSSSLHLLCTVPYFLSFVSHTVFFFFLIYFLNVALLPPA